MKNYLVLIIFLVLTINLIAQEGFKTRTVSVFKNNSAFFTKKGTIQPKGNHYIFNLETMPRAAYGTFWLSGQNLMHLTSYQKEFITVKNREIEHIPAKNHDFLKINKGKKVNLIINKETSFQGTIKEVSKYLVFLELENGQLLSLNTGSIQYVFLLEESNGFNTTNRSDTTKGVKQIVDLQFKNNAKQNLDLIYFQNGIGWTPSYKVELQENSKAKITMQAAVSNQAEDLDDVNINFVVGYPNIKYASTLDILFNNAGIAQLPTITNNYLQLTDRARRGGLNVYYDGDFSTGTALSTVTTNQPSIKSVSEEDLYFYSLNNISIPKGGRGYFSIFETTVPYEDLYEVTLTPNHNNYYSYQAVDYKDEYRNKVWHILKLENKSKHAWTTGAAMVVKKDGDNVRPISQDDLNYTPMQGKGTLKLTISPDVSVKDYEKEKTRTARKQEKDSYYYEIVTVSGEIKIQNFKSEAINLNIKKAIVGNLTASNPKWLKSARVNTHTSFNRTNEVCWEIKLDAGEKKVIEYEYDVYVRR